MERKKILINLAIIVIIALLAGLLGFFLVFGFVYAKNIISNRLISFNDFLPIWAILGAFLVGAVIYKLDIRASGEGLPSYIAVLNSKDKRFSFSETFYKFWAALLTLSTFGIGGIIGPLGRVSAGLISRIVSLFNQKNVSKKYYRIAAICGLASVIGTVFNSSIGGGVFAVEILKKDNIDYQDLFPSILASSTAVFIATAFNYDPFYHFRSVDLIIAPYHIFLIIAVAFFSGIIGKLYTWHYNFLSNKLHRNKKTNILIKVLFFSFISSFIAYIINPELLGTSDKMFEALFSDNFDLFMHNLNFLPIFVIFIILALTKLFTNSLTVASGMSAGFTGPAALIGLLIGAAFSNLFQIIPFTGVYYALLASGFSSVLASSMNIPLAASIITVESFGLSYGLPAGLSAIIGYQLNKQATLYVYAREHDNEIA